MYDIKRTDDEINDCLNKAADLMDSGTKVPGMSYEQGVHDALQWIIGNNDDNPMEDEAFDSDDSDD